MVGHSLLRRAALLSIRHPVLFLFAEMGLAVFCLFFTFRNLEFKTSRNDLVSAHQKYVQLAATYEDDFAGMDDLIVVVRSHDPEAARSFADTLATKLRNSSENIKKVFYKVDPSVFEGKKLLFLDADALDELAEQIEKHGSFLESLSESPSLRRVFSFINRKMKEKLVGAGINDLLGAEDDSQDSDAGDARRLKFLTALLRQLNDSLQEKKTTYQSPWAEFFGNGGLEDDGYLTTGDGRLLLMQVKHIESKGFLKHASALRFIRHTIAELHQQFPAVQAGVTGQPALGADEMTAAQHDMKLAGILSLLGVVILFIITFHEIRRPLLVILSLLIGIAWTMGILTATVGHLSILSVAFTSILIGLGIDFGFHLLARYEEERGNGFAFNQAIDIAFTQTMPGVLTTALTTAMAFFAVMLADFRGIQELGWISGSGILATFLSTIFCLPALLALSENSQRAPSHWHSRALSKILSRLIRHHSRLFIAAGLLATVIALPLLRKLSFDYNLLDLQSPRTESVRWEKALIKNDNESSWFAFTVAHSIEELRTKVRAFRKLPAVHDVKTILDIIPDDQEQKIKNIAKVSAALDEMELAEFPSPGPPDIARLRDILEKCKFTLRKRKEKGSSGLDRQIEEARGELLDLVAILRALPPEAASERLHPFQTLFFSDFAGKLGLLRKNVHPTPLSISDIPPSIRSRFVSNHSTFLMRIYSARNIWERENMLNFVAQTRTVDPDVTGPPVIGSESITLMKQGYIQGGLYAFLVIFVIVLITFRRLGDVILALVPVILGSIWTMGIMALIGLQFNLANLVVIPLIIGVAVDGGIHMVHRAREDQTARHILMGSTTRAVILSFLSTMIGFGSLMVADHYGIFSLGLLFTIAMGCSLVVSLLLLPALLTALPHHR